MSPFTHRTALCASLAAILILPACQSSSEGIELVDGRAPGQFEKAENSEKLLEARGAWKLVEEARAPTPLELHALAREGVNPDNLKTAANNIKNPVEIKDGQEVHYRQLRMDIGKSARGVNVDKLLPAKSNLIVTEKELAATLDNLEKERRVKAQEKAQATKVLAARQRAEREMAALEPAARASSGFGNDVTAMRFGHYPDKSRVVLDLKSAVKYTAKMDGDKTVRVDLQGSGWSANKSADINNHPLVKSYKAEISDKGTALVLELKKPARITLSEALPANDTYPNPRIFFDIAPL